MENAKPVSSVGPSTSSHEVSGDGAPARPAISSGGPFASPAVSSLDSQVSGSQNLPVPRESSDDGPSARPEVSSAGPSTFPAVSSFLMVCLGNICRSPLAEGILQDKARAAGLDWTVDSAGTTSYHIGEAPHHLSQKVARINGVDISKQRARKFEADDFQRFDKIYAMAGDVLDQIRRIAGRQYDPNKVELLLNELNPGSDADVPDPWYGPEPGYHEVYKLIDAAADRIIEKYRHSAASAGGTNTQSSI